MIAGYVKYAKAAEKGLKHATCYFDASPTKVLEEEAYGDLKAAKTEEIKADLEQTDAFGQEKLAESKESLEDTKTSLSADEECSMSWIHGDAVAHTYAEKDLKHGTCVNQGDIKAHLKSGSIIFVMPEQGGTDFVAKEVLTDELTSGKSLHEISNDTCGQSDLDCQYPAVTISSVEPTLSRKRFFHRVHRIE